MSCPELPWWCFGDNRAKANTGSLLRYVQSSWITESPAVSNFQELLLKASAFKNVSSHLIANISPFQDCSSDGLSTGTGEARGRPLAAREAACGLRGAGEEARPGLLPRPIASHEWRPPINSTPATTASPLHRIATPNLQNPHISTSCNLKNLKMTLLRDFCWLWYIIVAPKIKASYFNQIVCDQKVPLLTHQGSKSYVIQK